MYLLTFHRDEWNELYALADRGLQHVQKHTLQMHLELSRLRSIYWQLLLGALPITPSLWIPKLRQQRNSYRLLRQRLTVDPHQANSDDNPLSQNCEVSSYRCMNSVKWYFLLYVTKLLLVILEKKFLSERMASVFL